MKLAIVPSCESFDEHFGALNVSPSDLADGVYRGTWITQYAAELQSHGIETTVVLPSRRPQFIDGKVLQLALIPESFLYKWLPSALRRWRLREAASVAQARKIARQLKGFDVIYVQEYAYVRFGALLQKASGTPVVGAHHGTSINDLRPALRSGLKAANAQYTVLTRTEEQLLGSYLGSIDASNPVTRIPNWVDDRWFGSAHNAGEHSSVVWVGRIDEKIKGLDILLDAVEIVAASSGIRLTIVGTGPDEAKLRKRVDDSHVLNRMVRFTGRIDDVELLIKTISEHQVFVNSSVKEGFPLAVLEAMAAGRLTVLSALPYVLSEMQGAPGVRTFRVGDAQSLAEALVDALASEGNGLRASAWVNENFSRTVMLTRLVSLLHPAAHADYSPLERGALEN